MPDRLDLLMTVYSRPTVDQALCEAMKDYINFIEPTATAKLEAIAAVARADAAKAMPERNDYDG